MAKASMDFSGLDKLMGNIQAMGGNVDAAAMGAHL